jgi:hypothetical protein
MLRVLNHRTAVAIALIGVMLFSVGTCLLPAQSATHSCCAHMSMPCGPSARNCCTASPQTPPALVKPAVNGIASIAAAPDLLPVRVESAFSDAVAAPLVHLQSSPPGVFILRI